MIPRRLTLVTFLAMAAAIVPASELRAQTSDEELLEFNIPPGNLMGVLVSDFPQQSGRRVLTMSKEVADMQTAGVSGIMSRGKALERLLAGTGMTFMVDELGGYDVGPLSNVRVPGGRCVRDKKMPFTCRQQ